MIKNLKLSVLALLALVATMLTSCLGESENTQYVSGVGTVVSTSTIRLDNGLYLQSENLTGLSYDDRVYIYGTVDGDAYEAAVAKLQSGGQGIVTLQEIYSGGVFETEEGVYTPLSDYESELENHTSSAISDLDWCSYGSFGNGYLNMTVTCDYYVYSSGNSNNLVPVEFSMIAKTVDPVNKKLELVLVYDNGESQCVDADGKLLDGYTKVSNSTLPLSFNLVNLYYTLAEAGLSDDDQISLSVAYVTNDSEKGEAKEVCSDGYALTGMYNGLNYFTLSVLKKIYY